MMKTIPLKTALMRIILEQHEKPIISTYEISWYLYQLYSHKKFDNIKIGKIKANEPDPRIIYDSIAFLEKRLILRSSVNSKIYYITSKVRPSAQQLVCCINPYSYLAYISAMEWHGITDRIPKELHIICSTSAYLKKNILKKIKKEFPNITNPSYLIPNSVCSISNYDGKKIIFHKTTNFKQKLEQFESGGVRVSNIGETFLDMLKFPERCGGFNHVISVFQNYAEKYLPLIVKEINQTGNSMDKARAGYILEDLCNLKHKEIDNWAKNVQRGGSRRLITTKPYSHIFSERWCISLNT